MTKNLIRTLTDLAEHLGVSVPDGAGTVPQVRLVARAVYNGTTCGAWFRFVPPITAPDGEPQPQYIEVGSIVEGVEFGTSTHRLYFPFAPTEYDAAIEAVETEANDIWLQTHGCPACFDGRPTVNTFEWEAGPEDLGARVVDPFCPECMGEGTIV